jgi:hypothetical protein
MAVEADRAKIERAVGRLIRQYRGRASRQERRRQDRVDFVHPVTVWTEDGNELTVLSRDLSLTGVRLISSFSLLGQKVHVLLPAADGGNPYHFFVQVLWSYAVGDGLFENGAMFLDMFPRGTGRLRLVRED